MMNKAKYFRALCLMVSLLASVTSLPMVAQDLWPADGNLELLVVPESTEGTYTHLAYPSWGPRTHFGVDLLAPEGRCVRAPADGVVETMRFHNALGNYMIIRHDAISRRGEGSFVCDNGESITLEDKSASTMRTIYLHLANFADIEEGDEVAMGEVIGNIGHTGTASNGVNHTHFELRYFEGLYGPHTSCDGGGNIYHCGDAHCEPWAWNDWENPATYRFSSILVEDALDIHVDRDNSMSTIELDFEVTEEMFATADVSADSIRDLTIYRDRERQGGIHLSALSFERVDDRRFRISASFQGEVTFDPGEMLNLRFDLDNGTWQLPAFVKKHVYFLDVEDFDDVDDGAWYSSWIADGIDLGLFKGTGRSFRPGDDLNRAEMSKVVLTTAYKVQREGVTAPGGTVDISPSPDEPFLVDVRPCGQYFMYIQSLKNSGVVEGYAVSGGHEFRPFNPITRGELSKFLVEALDIRRGEHPGRNLADLVDSNPDASPDDETWATYYMQVLYHEGRIDGMRNPDGDGLCLCPGYGVRRAEMAKFMVNSYKYKIGDNDPGEDNDVVDRATVLRSDAIPMVAHGVLFPEEDDDWYSFAINDVGALEIRYSPISDVSRPARLEVYGPAEGSNVGPRIAETSSTNPGVELLVNRMITATGTYHALVQPVTEGLSSLGGRVYGKSSNDSYTLTIAAPGDPPEISVRIDVKPGSENNPFNPRSQGKTPVAILSTSAFDALQRIDVGTLTFGRTGAETSIHIRGNGLPNCSPADVNGDGLIDLFCRFMTQKTGILQGDTRAILRGRTYDGQTFEGFDAITIVGLKDDADGDGVGDKEESETPNAGDGNGDSVADVDQGNISSLRSKVTGRFITLEADGTCINTDVRSMAPIDLPADPAYSLRQGALEFQLTGIAGMGCGRSNVTLIFHGEPTLDGAVYRKLVGTQWSTFPATFGRRVIGGKTVATAELFLVDGGPGDGDGVMDGVITDPGGPAYPIAADAIPTMGTFGLAFLALLLGLAGVAVVRQLAG